jgi:hypothetical protein
MNENTKFIYENVLGKLVFEHGSPLWVTDVDGVSSVEVEIFESRSAGQTGASMTAQSVRPRSFTVDGAIFEPISATRGFVLGVMAPGVPSTLTIVENGESWFLDVVPERTPEITPGNGVQFFQTKLRAEYPYWRTTEFYAVQMAGLEALFRFPFFTGGRWNVSRFSESYFKSVENSGNVPIDFKVTFSARAALENPELHHVDTGKQILIRKSMAAGEQVVVSTIYGEKGVVCVSSAGEKENGFKYLSIGSDLSMALVPGQNLLRIGASVNREGLGVRIEAPMGVKSGV